MSKTEQAVNPEDALTRLLPSSKGEKTRERMILASIGVVANQGIDKLTFEALAKECGVTRQLVKHYFPEKSDLVRCFSEHIRRQFQALAVGMLKEHTQPKEMLDSYVRSTFFWLREFPDHARAWNFFLCYCSTNTDFRRINAEYVAIGHSRIEALLKFGIAAGQFHPGETSKRARAIQLLITAGLVSESTETPGVVPHELENLVLCQVRLTAGVIGFTPGS